MTDFLNAYDVQPDELTISEVAKILRCSRQMVLKICHKYKDLFFRYIRCHRMAHQPYHSKQNREYMFP